MVRLAMVKAAVAKLVVATLKQQRLGNSNQSLAGHVACSLILRQAFKRVVRAVQ